MNWIKKHKIWSGIIGVILLGAVINASGGGNNANPPANNNNQAAEEPAEKPKLDIAAFYAKVQSGMTKEEVVNLAEKDAGNCTESEIQGYGTSEVCNWYGNFGDNAFATVIFKDGKVESKSKTGF